MKDEKPPPPTRGVTTTKGAGGDQGGATTADDGGDDDDASPVTNLADLIPRTDIRYRLYNSISKYIVLINLVSNTICERS